jgi:hypothetical protein
LSARAAELADRDAVTITNDRRELKYFVPAGRAASFVRSMSPLLALHRYLGAGSNPLPRAQHFTTTVYFDTDTQALCRAALTQPVHVKARAREYYDVHADLTELPAHPRELLRYQPVLWIEVKQRDGERSRKSRVAVPKAEVAGFLESLAVSAAIRRLQPAGGRELDRVIAELGRLRAQLGRPLRASCIVNYRRLSWENSAGTLRITLDRELCAFAPLPDLWTRREALTRELLGEPAHRVSPAVLEVKSRDVLPEWLDALLADHAAQAAGEYSKFVMASRAVHGEIV